MIELLALAAAQVETLRLPQARPTAPVEVPSPGVETLKLKPDLVVKDIRLQDNFTMHVLIANTGTGTFAERFPVSASVEIGGESYDLTPVYADPIPARDQAWITLRTDFTTQLTLASSAMAAADQYLEPKVRPGGWSPWPTINTNPYIPGTKAVCRNPTGCIAELDESNNNYAVAGVPRGTPERLNAPGLAPERMQERGNR